MSSHFLTTNRRSFGLVRSYGPRRSCRSPPHEEEASSALQKRLRPRPEKKTTKKPKSYVLAEDSDSLEDACARLKAHPKFRPNKHHYGFSLPPSLRKTASCNDGKYYKFFWNPCRALEAVSFTSGRGAVNKVVSDPGKWLFYLYSGGDAPTPEMYAKRKPGLKTRPKEFIRDKKIGHGLGWNKDRADARSGGDVLAFQEFQKVLLPYCSSDKWIGDADEADWRVNRKSGGHVDKNVRFHGSRIVKAVATYVEDAVARTKGLGPTSGGAGISEAVLSGSSAGGAGAHLNACAVFHVMQGQKTPTASRGGIVYALDGNFKYNRDWKQQLDIKQERWKRKPLKKFGILIDSAWYVRGPSTDKLWRYHNEYNFVGGERNPEGQRWNGLEMDYQVGFGVWKPNIADGCGRASGWLVGEYNATEGWKCFFPHTHARHFLRDANNRVCGEELLPEDPVRIRPFFAAHGYDSYLKGRGDGGGSSHQHLGHLRGRGKQYLQELLDVIGRTPASDSFGFFVSASVGHVLMDVGKHNAVMRAKVHGTLLNEVLKRWWSYEWKNESSFRSASSNGRNSTSNLAEVWKAKGQYANSCIWGETDKCVALAGGKLKGSNPTFGAHNGRGGFNDGTEQWLAALQEANEKAEAVQKQEEWKQVCIRYFK
eukprot:g5047.t1